MAIHSMSGRDIHEEHRVSTTLELFFDLIIVVAVAQASGGLHHLLLHGDYIIGIIRYLMAFWCVFLCWLNFSWFDSAYDTDDVPYRLTVTVHMLGAIILAVGVNDIFKPEPDVKVAFIGFLIMRLALLSQWLRAAAHLPTPMFLRP